MMKAFRARLAAGDKPNIMIATPCFGGMVTQRYLQSTYSLLQFGNEAGWNIGLELNGFDSLITRSRNSLVTRFLKKADATHLMFIDADIGFEVEQVIRMLAFNQDIVGGMYPLKLVDWSNGGLSRAVQGEAMTTAPLRYVGTPCENDEAESDQGFVTGVYVGTGFLLIKREAILRMTTSYPQLRYRGNHTAAVINRDVDEYALFDCMIDPDSGVYLSEDYTFCRRWRDIGGRIWLDTQGSLIHIGSHEFHGAPASRFPAVGGGMELRTSSAA